MKNNQVGVILNKEHIASLKKAMVDIFYFANFVYIIHPMRGKVQFKLYPFQKSVLWEFLTNRFNIVLKFRQAGITELIALFCLWTALFKENQNVQIISIKDKVAKKVLRRIKYMYKNLPDYMKVRIVNGTGNKLGTTEELEFENGSTITSIPTTEDAGRSEAVSLLVIDEAAILRWASTIWAAAFPTLSTGGSAIVNSCVTGDTEIMTKKGPLRVDRIAPKEFGRHSISHLGLEVLSHTGSYKRILGSVNKGDLETWEITNDRGKVLKCTPDHKLLTINGWRSVRKIVEKGLKPIFYDLYTQEAPPITIKPKKEEFRAIPGFPNYLISNWGKVYIIKDGKFEEKAAKVNGWGYRTISIWDKGKRKKMQVNRLMASIFIGEIPDGHQVDHINCNKLDDYITNLQIISPQKNYERGAKYSNSLNLGAGRQRGGWGDLRVNAFIKREYAKHKIKGTKDFQDLVIDQIQDKFGVEVKRTDITRIGKGTRCKKVYTSKLEVKRKYIDTIYDISVEDDQSYLTLNQYVNHNTPYGIGNWFHQTWVEACSSGRESINDFNPIRLHWDMHPERDINWYNDMKNILGPRRTAQEIDGDFLTSGNSVFDLMDIKAIEDSLSEYLPIKLGLNGNLRIYKAPQKGKKYFVGADIASGRARDYSAFTIMDKDGEEVACFKGKITIERFAKLLFDISHYYNIALLAPEANDIGQGVIKLLQEWNYPNLYYTLQLIKEKNNKKAKKAKIPGWVTSTKNRHTIIMELEADVRNDEIVVKDPFFVQEAYTFIYNEMNKPIAMGKDKVKGDQGDELYDQVYSDDAILAKSITNFVRKGKSNSIVVAPK